MDGIEQCQKKLNVPRTMFRVSTVWYTFCAFVEMIADDIIANYEMGE